MKMNEVVLFLLLCTWCQIGLQAQIVNVDPDYGNGGLRTIDFGNTFEVSVTSTRQADNKLLLCGTIGSGDGRRIALARLDANGNLDPSFGSGGKKILTYDPQWAHEPKQLLSEPDGKITLAFFLNENNEPKRMLARLLPNGQADTSFGENGFYKTSFERGETWAGFHKMANGKYMCFGSNSIIFDGTFYGRVTSFRLNPNGSLDTSYNRTNFRIHRLRSIDLVRESPIFTTQAPNGSFALYCSAQNPVTSVITPILLRLKSNGDFDSTFAQSGLEPITIPGVTPSVQGIYVDAQNRIRLPGRYRENSNAIQYPSIFGFRATGGFDPTFGNNGRASIILPNQVGFNSFVGTDLAFDSQNRLYLSFFGHSDLSVSRVFAVARFTPEGQPDTTFAAGGYVATNLPGSPQKIYLATDGWPIVTGQTNLSSVAVNDDLVAVKIKPATASLPETIVLKPLFPNPVTAGEVVNLPFSPGQHVRLFDATGKEVSLEGKLHISLSNAIQLKTQTLKPGLYRIGPMQVASYWYSLWVR